MDKKRALLLAILLALPLSSLAQTPWNPPQEAGQYVSRPLPAHFLPKKVPAMETELAAYERFTFRGLGPSIKDFIERYGAPSRFLASTERKGRNYLVYDLPSGHTIVVHALKPPREIFTAVDIIDATGAVIRTIQ